jgi:ABC-type siderophore export system fused ATPase/permease subunit
MTLLDRLFHTPETQATVTVGAGAAYLLTLQDWIGILTVVLLVGQLGLLAVKYYKVYKEWKAKRASEN